MSILFEHLNKEKNLTCGTNVSMLKSPQTKNRNDMSFLTELKSNLRYRKKKVDEFIRVDKITFKPNLEVRRSESYSSEKNKQSVKKQAKSYLKLDYKKIIDKKCKTFKNKNPYKENVLPEVFLFQKKVVNLESDRSKNEGNLKETKLNQSFRESKIKVKDAAQAIMHSISTKNQLIFENFLKRIKGINEDFENVLLKVYKNCFDMEKYELNLDVVYDMLIERHDSNYKTMMKSNTFFYQNKAYQSKPDLKFNVKFTSTYSADRPKKTFSYNQFYKFKHSKDTFEVPHYFNLKQTEQNNMLYNTRSGFFTIKGKGSNKEDKGHDTQDFEEYKLHRKVIDSRIVNREVNMIKSNDNCEIGRKTESDWLVIKKSRQDLLK